MATTRDITTLMSIHLGINVARYAARLVRAGMLPQRGRRVDEDHVASLLLAVAAAADPSRAVEALEQLAGASLYSILRPIPVTGFNAPVWQPATSESYDLAPASAADLITLALRGGMNVAWAAIDDGGAHALFEVKIGSANPVHLRVGYAVRRYAGSAGAAGLIRVTKFFGDVVTSLARAIRPEAPNIDAKPISLDLH